MSNSALIASLTAVSTGDIDIRGARAAIRAAIQAGGEMIDAAYTAIRETTFRIVSSRDADVDLTVWYDLSTHAATLARRAARDDVSERLTGFSELIAQTGRFADRQPIDEVLRRRHVADLIAVLAEHGSEAPRAMLIDRVGLADANLSRVLGILSTHGLVTRRRDGKEAHIRLTEAGQIAAAKLGHAVAIRAGDPARWWQALSWPVGVWTADGEPVAINDALRAFAEDFACPTPSMLNFEGWSDWLDSILQDSRGTDERTMRDLRIDDEHWVRLIEDRLAGGERIVMLIDTSSQLRSQVRLERRLRTAEEQIAAARAELASTHAKLAETKAKLEDTERRLLSFTTWLEFLKNGVVGETTSLATRLRKWTGRLRPGPMRAEAELADRQIVTLRRAMQTLLYTSYWTSDTIEPLQRLDTNLLISDSVEIVRTLSRSDIDIDFHADIHLQEVCGNEPVLRATIGQGILNYVHEKSAPHYFVRTMVRDKFLDIVCVGLNKPRTGSLHNDLDWYHQRAHDAGIYEFGFAHARDVAEIIGGTVQTGKDQSFVLMSLPIAAPPPARRTRAIASK